MQPKTRRRVAFVTLAAVFLASLICSAPHPAGPSQPTFVARWVGLRVWYATQLTLRLAARTETPRPLGVAASLGPKFPSDLIQPRV